MDGNDPPDKAVKPSDDVHVTYSPGCTSAVAVFGNENDGNDNGITESGMVQNENENTDDAGKVDGTAQQKKTRNEDIIPETDEARLEALAIKNSRMNIMGERVKSAEPYGYWQDLSAKPAGYMKRVVGVHFKNTWSPPTPEDIDQLIKVDLGLEDPSKALTSMGINGKRITLTAIDQVTKRDIFNRLNEKYFHKYHVVMLEDEEVHVDLFYVPEDLPDNELLQHLGKFGEINNASLMHCKNKYGIYNLQIKMTFKKLVYDIPSYLKVKGYQIQARYKDQPKTCRLCGTREHEAKDCSINVSNNRLYAPQENKEAAPSTSRIQTDSEDETVLTEDQVSEMVNAMEHTIQMHERHPGGGRQYKTPEFKNMMAETVDKLKSLKEKNLSQQEEATGVIMMLEEIMVVEMIEMMVVGHMLIEIKEGMISIILLITPGVKLIIISVVEMERR